MSTTNVRPRRWIVHLAICVALALVASLFLAAPATAAHVTCGQVITTNTTLDSDVGPCSDDGIIIGADYVTLNLNGHRVFGTPNRGDGAGILVSGRRGVHVTNGVVSNFDGGVVIEGGSHNQVSKVTARDNIGQSEAYPPGPATEYGDGIAIMSSSHNSVVDNTLVHNGPFSGVGVFEIIDPDHPRETGGPAHGNLIARNTALDNNICRSATGACDDDGIRLEPGVEETTVVDNTVRGSGLDGIAIFRTANNNVVQRNVVEANGFHTRGHRKGNGIQVFSDRNLVQDNRAFGNAADGIGVAFRTPRGVVAPAVDNRLLNNRTGGNVQFDLHDINPNCDNNIWSGNTFQKADPPCTTAVVTCGSRPVTVVGTNGNDTLSGTAGNDVINALAGNDTVNGGGGYDIVCGGGGNDAINSGTGNDVLYGDAGSDQLNGGPGNDALYGGDGFDTLRGAAGDDYLSGDAGTDVAYGDAGNDQVYGGADNDALNGGAGNDHLFGQAGQDVIHGDADNDRLSGGTENDQLYGDAGNDALDGGPMTGPPGNYCRGGTGTDTATNCQTVVEVP